MRGKEGGTTARRVVLRQTLPCHVCKKSAELVFDRMSTARMVMKNAKKNAAVYSAKASAARRVILTKRILDIEKVSKASQRPTILMTQTTWPVRQIGRRITTHQAAQARKRSTIRVLLAVNSAVSGYEFSISSIGSLLVSTARSGIP